VKTSLPPWPNARTGIVLNLMLNVSPALSSALTRPPLTSLPYNSMEVSRFPGTVRLTVMVSARPRR